MKNNQARQTRRNFLGSAGSAGLGLAATGAITSVGAQEPMPVEKVVPETMLGQYFRRFREIMTAFKEQELEKIGQAADMAGECIEGGGKLYSALGGHLIRGEGGDTSLERIGNPELFHRDTDNMKAGDFLITMSETQAMEAREKGVKTVGWTSPMRRKRDTPPLGLQNPQEKMLEEVCDITIECHVPYTEGILYTEKIHTRPIPGSGQMMLLFYWTLTTGIAGRLAAKGKSLPVAGS